ncbi:MAG: hypothetical protein ABEJ65_03355 [bacterium]
MSEFTLWIESIKSDQIVLTDGKHRIDVSVTSHDDPNETTLPEEFRKATIDDKFTLQFEKREE